MQNVEVILQSITLPINLPKEAFFIFGAPRRLPDIDIIVQQLPSLNDHIDMSGTVIRKSTDRQENTFILALTDGYHLRITIRDQAIVALNRI